MKRFCAGILPAALMAIAMLVSSCSAPDGAPDGGMDGGGDASIADVGFVPGDAGHFAPLSCPGVPGTDKTLKQKAEYFDALGQSLHIPAGQDLWFSAWMKDDLKTFDKVDMSDNVGTWSAIYSASQAFRYAATGSTEALDNLKRIVRGEHDMMKITGRRGLFTRVIVNPALPGFPSAKQLGSWYPDCDLAKEHCKCFLEVKDGEFAGKWFKTDVSKDEYAAHMFAMSVILEIVGDPEVRAMAADIVTQVGDMMVDNELQILDVDGRVTTYGSLNATGLDDYTGFNATLALSWVKLAAYAGGKKYADFYNNCLLQKKGRRQCIRSEAPFPYTDYLDNVGLDKGCKTNWNNHNMAQLGMYPLISYENDPVLKARYRQALKDQLWAPDDPFPMRDQQKTLYTMMYLVNKDPADEWPEAAARDALCVMKTFPEHKAHYAVDNFADHKQYCQGRDDDLMTMDLIPIYERGMDNFVWINNPYSLEKEDAEPRHVESPEDYLLAYWMGRFYGFFTEEM